jgi:CPA2 family monovalent cation:H+ antiporter-2
VHLGEQLLVLGVLFVIAYILGRLGKLVGLPAIPVYMVVGLLASPYTGWFPLSIDSANVELIAVFGLIFLLFNLGLEFDQDEFFSNAKSLLLSGGTRILINMVIGFGFGMWVGWGTREALIIAGMTATSSSAIVTKLLIELRRLTNPETPVILGIMVLEDIFVAVYLAIVAVIIGGETDVWQIVLELSVSFAFIVGMFALARWGGRFVSRLIHTKDDELFTILFFGLAVAFGGIGELLGVSDAIGAFLIGLVLGATRWRTRIENIALPLRDVFGAFFFLNFGLTLNIATFGSVIVPVAVGVIMTLVINTAGGQLIAWMNKLTPAQGLNVSAMLQNRGEFALILATLAAGAGLDERLTPFAGLYVLIMAIVGPILAVNSESLGALIFRRSTKRRAAAVVHTRMDEENFALVEAAMEGADLGPDIDEDVLVMASDDAVTRDKTGANLAAIEDDDDGDDADDVPSGANDPLIAQAMQQSDEIVERKRDPEY